jgi:hypothetical protein
VRVRVRLLYRAAPSARRTAPIARRRTRPPALPPPPARHHNLHTVVLLVVLLVVLVLLLLLLLLDNLGRAGAVAVVLLVCRGRRGVVRNARGIGRGALRAARPRRRALLLLLRLALWKHDAF